MTLKKELDRLLEIAQVGSDKETVLIYPVRKYRRLRRDPRFTYLTRGLVFLPDKLDLQSELETRGEVMPPDDKLMENIIRHLSPVCQIELRQMILEYEEEEKNLTRKHYGRKNQQDRGR